MKILVFGNPLVAGDSLPLRLLPGLRKKFPGVTFQEFDAAEDLELEGKDLFILDAAQGIRTPRIIRDLDSIELSPRFSLHDFDLGLQLKLMKKAGLLGSATILAVPQRYPVKRALSEVSALIESILP